MHDIARNLKRLRRQKGLTQEALADKLHVTRQAVSNWERNRNLPELEVLLSAAEALGASMDELLYGPRAAAPPDGPENRRKKVITAAVLWGIWGAALTFHLTWGLSAHEAIKQFDRMTDYWIDICLLQLLCLLAFGMALCALVCVWRDLHPRRPAIRRSMFWLGICTAALLLLVVNLLPVVGPRIGLWPRLIDLWSVSLKFHSAGIPYLLCGGLIFCGWGRKAG